MTDLMVVLYLVNAFLAVWSFVKIKQEPNGPAHNSILLLLASVGWLGLYFGSALLLSASMPDWGRFVLSPLGRMIGWAPMTAALVYMVLLLSGAIRLRSRKRRCCN